MSENKNRFEGKVAFVTSSDTPWSSTAVRLSDGSALLGPSSPRQTQIVFAHSVRVL